MKKILAIDDDQAVLNYLNIMLLQTGLYEVTTLANSGKAFHELKAKAYDLLILDMDMPDVSGLDILKHIKEKNIDIETIVLTGVEDVELAVSAMKLGAFDYLTKPVDNDQLLTIIATVLENRKARAGAAAEIPFSADNLKFKDAFKEIITQNEEMIRMFQMVEKMAQPDNSILIWGESGTGKELIAKAIHRISKRRDENFVAVNAGTFANELFSSEFFGHNKGAFTGASAAKKGFLEEADKGTLFLDEIGELALPIQVKLLRVLQEGEFFRLGSTKNQKVDVRIIAATNKDLLSEMKKGNFRKDLFYRLNMSSVYLPPLRERKGDIPLLEPALFGQIQRTEREKDPENLRAGHAPAEPVRLPGQRPRIDEHHQQRHHHRKRQRAAQEIAAPLFPGKRQFQGGRGHGIAAAEPGAIPKRNRSKRSSSTPRGTRARRRKFWASRGSISWRK